MIDEDPGMLALVEALLADGGIRVEGMSEPEMLWKMLETAPPDALILDVDNARDSIAPPRRRRRI
jgi:DNA-binding response OmpR family regulator